MVERDGRADQRNASDRQRRTGPTTSEWPGACSHLNRPTTMRGTEEGDEEDEDGEAEKEEEEGKGGGRNDERCKMKRPRDFICVLVRWQVIYCLPPQ